MNYKLMNSAAIEDTLDLLGVDKAMVDKLYTTIDRAESRGYQAGHEAGYDDGVIMERAEQTEQNDRISLREWSKGYMDGAARARTAPGVADQVIEGIIQQGLADDPKAEEPFDAERTVAEFYDSITSGYYEGDSGDECQCTMCYGNSALCTCP